LLSLLSFFVTIMILIAFVFSQKKLDNIFDSILCY
jgi:hypothetical protein